MTEKEKAQEFTRAFLYEDLFSVQRLGDRGAYVQPHVPGLISDDDQGHDYDQRDQDEDERILHHALSGLTVPRVRQPTEKPRSK